MIQNLCSPVGLGTAGFEALDKQHAIKLIDCALDVGLTHIDTAEMYGWGESEQRIGDALHGKRHQAFIGTKVWPRNASLARVKTSCEASLKRLQTDYIDLYTLHWPSPYSLDETMESLLTLKEDGKIRHIGVSNFTQPLLAELQAKNYADEIFSNQVMYNLNERLAETHVFAACREAGLYIVGYSPLSGGASFTVRPELEAIAVAHGKTPHQVALNYLHNGGDVYLIPKSTKIYQLTQIAESLNFTLAADERTALSRAYPIVGPRDNVSVPINDNHYFQGDYNRELKPLFETLNLA